MNRLLKWLGVILPLLVCAPAWAQQSATGPGPTAMTPTPDDRAKQWLILLDDKNYADAYKQLAKPQRSRYTPAAWASKVGGERAPMGATASRSLDDVKLVGNTAIVRYDSVFAHKASVVETVTLTNEKGGWSVTSYSVQ